MNWTKEDVESVAKARVTKQERALTNKFLIAGMAIAVIGIFLGMKTAAAGIVGVIIGGGIVYYRLATVERKQKVAALTLTTAWLKEQGK